MLFLFRSSLVLMGVLILSWRMDFVLDVSPKFVLGGGGGTFEANEPKLTFGMSLEL